MPLKMDRVRGVPERLRQQDSQKGTEGILRIGVGMTSQEEVGGGMCSLHWAWGCGSCWGGVWQHTQTQVKGVAREREFQE